MLQQRIPDPCALVIFGASGDLTRRKLVPAIWHLQHQGRLPQVFHLVGVARREWDDDLFRQKMRESLAEFVGPLDDSARDAFLAKFHYVRGDPGDPATYAALKARLEALNRECGTEGNRCFYCSVPPQIYRDIVEQLGRAGLSCQHRDCHGWCRIIVEKPFGHNYDSARELNQACIRSLPKSRSTASITTSARRPFRTSSFFASAIQFLNRCGTGVTSITCRSPRPRASAWNTALATTTNRVPCAT